jgi:protein TonB
LFPIKQPVSSPSPRALCIAIGAHGALIAVLLTGRFVATAGPVRHWQATLIAPAPLHEKVIARVAATSRVFRPVPLVARHALNIVIELPPAPLMETPRVPVPEAEFPRLERPRARLKIDTFGEWTPVGEALSTRPPASLAEFGGTKTFQAAARNTVAKTGLFEDSAVATGSDSTLGRAARVGGFSETVSAPSVEIPRHAILNASFGDSGVSNAVSPRRSTPVSAVSGVEILYKPRPSYTEEARRLRIEGEVFVEMMFGTSGEARDLRVVKGLGHGLDENAIAAAREIRFRSAVDTTAIVHIVFQLAY